MKYSISIILPVLNEIISLKKTLLIIDKIKVDKEFLIIYSDKLTKSSVKKQIILLKKKYKTLKHFKQTRPYVGGAIDTGIKNSKKKYIAIMASDLETNPSELKQMIKISSKNHKSIISADRWSKKRSFKGYGLLKTIANFIFQKLLKFFFGYKILDFTFAYRIYPKDALKGHRIKELRHGFALEILLMPMKKGFDIITVPSNWKKRIEGYSSITFESYLSYLRVLWRNLVN